MKMYLPPRGAKQSRRGFLKKGLFGGALLALGGGGYLATRSSAQLPLPAEGLTARLLRGKWYFHVFVWFAAPGSIDDAVSWELLYGDGKLAEGGSRLVTAGVVRDGRKLPERFRFYPYGVQTTVPEGDHDRMADFWRRLGIGGIEAHWTYGLPADEPTEYHPASFGEARGLPLPEGRVECISCHDPHNEAGLPFLLWTSNRRSSLCLTCHIK